MLQVDMDFRFSKIGGADPILLSLDVVSIRKVLGNPEETGTTNEGCAVDVWLTQDWGKRVVVAYDKQGVCEAVEIAAPHRFLLDGVNLLELTKQEAQDFLGLYDPALEVEYDYLFAPQLGFLVGFYERITPNVATFVSVSLRSYRDPVDFRYNAHGEEVTSIVLLPGEGTDDVKFGMSQEEVRARLGTPVSTYPDYDAYTADGCYMVFYDEANVCIRVDVVHPNKAILHSRDLIDMTMQEARDFLISFDDDWIEDYDLVFPNLGLRLHGLAGMSGLVHRVYLSEPGHNR